MLVLKRLKICVRAQSQVHVDWVSEATSSHQLYDQNDREDPETQPARSPIAEVIGHRSGIPGGTEGSNSLRSASESSVFEILFLSA